MNTKKQRNINIDLIKCIAVLSVICIHFFLNNSFYRVIINNDMYVSVFFRTAFMVCVPLFMLTTGYLMINKELSSKYYKGIVKTVSIYILASICCLIYRYAILNEAVTFKSALLGILDFSGAPYAWYVEMYIGLFILIPFLNLAYNNLKNDKQRCVLLITMIFLTTLPSLFNLKYEILPHFWTKMYPLTYYFI